MYCPWDVINYCDELLADAQAQPKNYWANTSGNGMVQRFIGKHEGKFLSWHGLMPSAKSWGLVDSV